MALSPVSKEGTWIIHDAGGRYLLRPARHADFILLSLLFGRNIGGLLVALGLVSWVRFARIARGQALQAKEFLFVEGARAMGASRRRIVLRHLLPNVLGPIVVTLTFSIPAAILAESTLSFIGLGINDPYSAWGTSWGSLAQDGWRAMRTYPHIIFFPAAAIFLTILAFNTLGNALRIFWIQRK
jgi:oligopeptide transport system permease protein